MLKKLNIKYQDFINESLYIQYTLSQMINGLPNKGPVSSLLLFLMGSESYSDDSTVNYISTSDTINMLKYPPKNRRVDKYDDDIFNITTQTHMKIGRVVRSILNGVDKSKMKSEFEGSATFNGKDISFSERENGKKFSKFYWDNMNTITSLDDDSQTTTFVKVFRKDKQVVGSEIADYFDNIYILDWDSHSKRDYFKMSLVDTINLKGTKDVRIEFEQKFAGKYIQDINDSDIEKFVNDITAFIKINMSPEGALIEEVKGESIRHWYDSDNYQSKAGQLGGSCMADSSCQEYLDIYTENPNQISLLILKSEQGKLVGRALLWNINDGEHTGKKFMDRVYTHTEYDVKIFEKWAIDNGCLYRNASNNGKIQYYFDGKKLPKEPSLFVIIDNSDFSYYPYIDTICFLDTVESFLSNKDQHDKELRDTEGRWTEYNNED